MLVVDAPITRVEDDKFGHTKLAEALADYVCDPISEAGSVVALTGGWGVGKSGILNLVKRAFQTRSLTFGGPTGTEFKPIFLRFEPWLVGSREAMISALFAQLIGEIDKLHHVEFKLDKAHRRRLRRELDRLRKKIVRFSDLASTLSSASSAFDPTGTSAFISVASRTSADLFRSIVTTPRSLDTEREEVAAALRDVATLLRGLRFVVLVDDLDRLEPAEVVETIRVVKAVAALPHITYLLAFDKPVVEHAIEQALGINDGASFLEKVIHFHLPVPTLHSRKLPQLLEGYLREFFKNDADYASRRGNSAIHVWGARLLRSPRDVKRLVSATALIWPSLKGRADLLDLVWIELLKLRASSKETDLYSWVRSYMMSVEHISFGGSVVGTSDDAKNLGSILEALGWTKYGGKILQGESFDFHQLSFFLPGIGPNYIELEKPPSIFMLPDKGSWQSFAAERRLGSPRHWRYYFGFSAPDSALTNDLLQEVAEAGKRSADDLVKALRNILVLREGDQQFPADQVLFENVEPRVANMDDLEASTWLEAIVKIAPELDSGSAEHFLPGHTNFKSGNRRLIAVLLQRLDHAARATLFFDLMRIPNSKWVLVDFFAGEQRLHDEKATRPTAFDDEHVFESDQFEIVAKGMSDALAQMSWEQLVAQGDPWRILFTWLDVNERAAGNWLLHQLSFRDLIVERLNHLVTHSYSGEATHDHLPAHYLDYFMASQVVRKDLLYFETQRSELAKGAKRLLAIWQDDAFGERDSKVDRAIMRELLREQWVLVFNQTAFAESKGRQGAKDMLFSRGGKILEGGNRNEASWRAADGQLELLNDNHEVHSRFVYQAASRRFVHTDEPDTKAIKGQYMILKSSGPLFDQAST